MIYFAYDPDKDLIKIGYSHDVPVRFKSLKRKCRNLTLLGCVNGGRDEEKSFHTAYFQHWQEGEWFRNHPSIVSYIERNKLEDRLIVNEMPSCSYGSGGWASHSAPRHLLNEVSAIANEQGRKFHDVMLEAIERGVAAVSDDHSKNNE